MNVKQHCFDFSDTDIDDRAGRYFRKLGHIDDEADYQKALNILGKYRSRGLEPKAIYAESEKGHYAYVLTAGVHLNTDQDLTLSEEIYADIWGTAYIAACLDVMQERFCSMSGHEDPYVINMWPGSNDVDISEIPEIFKILDASKIGVALTDSGVMTPIKSCAGYFKVEGSNAGEGGKNNGKLDCDSCLADRKHCDLCYAKVKKTMSV